MDAIKVLIADDNQIDRMVLSRIVRNQGYQVLEAENGVEAVHAFDQHRPDIILMDVMMPVMDGREAARRIKADAGEDFVPVIFLTSLTDAQSLADCLESGGDDFLSKPYNHIILQAKISSFYRMREMHRTVQRQRDTIASNNEHLLHEQHVAKAVFDNVAHAGCLSAPNIRYMLSPLAVFNGDVLLAARKPAGGMHVLLGDFTGHGLPAAIGAMPLAEIFYGMTAKGFALRDILREINLKLKGILPVGFFCCAVVVDLNFDRKSASIWMGGVPDCYMLRQQDTKIEILKSTHLPLGVLSNEQFSDTLTEYSMDHGDRLFVWSDGIIEARNPAGEMFGEERLKAVFREASAPAHVFDDIQHALADFVADSARDDDTTLLELRMIEEHELEDVSLQLASGPLSGPVDWQMSYHLGSETLKNFNPLPLMIHIMMEVPGLRLMGGQLYTVMAELFSNAFEHGVLGLKSELKRSSDGFMQYYREREACLAELREGYVIISMNHQGDGRSGRLILRVEDSGPGFDYSSVAGQQREIAAEPYCGRGIPLVNQICESLEYKGRGNIVEAVIRWPQMLDGRR
ncbi:ATP-binding SpoIIE family protein phosphatase [Thalassolituus hydrocarboniclasticus]|uniref:SpoIIE family protein phosphatase n=1 Tax=Thalassolituus hydrocarboniclasticus TaxID=2742796 RepID=A0ABY6ACR1_9GAMM|nr:SpoIIE family protein phosphatase [Thalassolituus hydrocarboniclasticus]UXD88229.1 SpoIIE family protein phosphatase [Thalassolituus hydrocarboniclasticus]